jgi:hypothetical protein
MKVRRSKAGFYKWLDTQQHRQDAVGRIARLIAEYKGWNSAKCWFVNTFRFGGPAATNREMAKTFAAYDRDRRGETTRETTVPAPSSAADEIK